MTTDERVADKFRTRSGIKKNVRRSTINGAVHSQHTLRVYKLGRTVETNSIKIQRRGFVAIVIVVFNFAAIVVVVDVVCVDDIVGRLKMNKIIADSKRYV